MSNDKKKNVRGKASTDWTKLTKDFKLRQVIKWLDDLFNIKDS